jgi:hypothetical protein
MPYFDSLTTLHSIGAITEPTAFTFKRIPASHKSYLYGFCSLAWSFYYTPDRPC